MISKILPGYRNLDISFHRENIQKQYKHVINIPLTESLNQVLLYHCSSTSRPEEKYENEVGSISV